MEQAAVTTTRQERALSALRELLILAGPVVMARLGIMIMGLTDAIVVGHHSARELGFHALGWAPTSIVLTTSVGLLMGVQVMTARHVGEGRRDEVGGVLRRGLIYAFWLGLGAVVVLGLFGPGFLSLMGLEPDLARGAGKALQVFAWSLPTYLGATVCIFFLEALSRPLAGMAAMWAANVVNLVANLWLVPGHSGFPVEGAVASGWATFIARAALFLFLAIFILRLPEAREFGLFCKPADGPKAASEQFRVGLGSGSSYFVEVGAFAAMTLFAGQLGGLQAAAWAVVLNLSAIIFMVPLGLASATGVLVSRAYGARDNGGVLRAGFLGFSLAGVVGLIVCAIVWPGAGLITRAYSTDPALIAIAAPAMALSCLFFVADALQVVGAQALRARGDVWLPTAFHLTSYGLIMLPLGWVFAHPAGLGVNGLVWAVILASLISATLLGARFAWLARRPL